MPEMKVMNMAGKEVGKINLSDAIFAADVNGAVLHAAVKCYLGNQRQGTQSTLTRTEVSGGGKKPYKQKGTGRARQGSTRAPQWTHGGIALGPKPRLYKTKTMVKMLADLGAAKKALVVLAEKDEKVIGSFANIPGVKVALTNTLNVYDILNCDSFIVAKAAAEKLEEVYA